MFEINWTNVAIIVIINLCVSKVIDLIINFYTSHKNEIKDSDMFVVYDLDTGRYYDRVSNLFIEDNLIYTPKISVPKDSKSYLQTFLLSSEGKKIIAMAKQDSDLRIGFKVINSNFEIIKEIKI